jgi:hypothetical protein
MIGSSSWLIVTCLPHNVWLILNSTFDRKTHFFRSKKTQIFIASTSKQTLSLYLSMSSLSHKHLVKISECHIQTLLEWRLFEWGWTARNLIAQQSIGQHFWQEINCSTQNLSTARIQLILAKPDSSKWQKYC